MQASSALDRLAVRGLITGYTIEPTPHYLSEGRNLMTYSVYGAQRSGRRNLCRLVRDLDRLGASIAAHTRSGTVATTSGLRRTRELAVIARLPGREALESALELVCELHAQGGSRPRAGSWKLPDVRVSAGGGARRGTVAAYAHTLPVDDRSAVVITLDSRPPLPGMDSHPVRVLEVWASYLAVAAG